MKPVSERAVLRIIDANINRSREGLRVAEEIARFILRSRTLTEDLKTVRHSISAIKKALIAEGLELIGSRDSENDPGRTLRIASEAQRKDCLDIFTANLERAKESLRVLEEFLKLTDAKRSAECLRLRFKVYEIEKRSFKKILSLRDR
jgi:thiamine-phosphate pyrophosphorylase